MATLPFQQNYGLIRKGVIDSYDATTNKMVVNIINNTNSLNAGNKQQIKITVPFTIASNNGLFIGSKPVKGTLVSVVQGEGNEGYFIGFLPQGKVFDNFPTLNDNEIIISGSKKSAIRLNTNDEIYIGNKYDGIKISTPSKQIDTYISSSIDNEYSFNQSKLSISGLVKREYKETFSYLESDKLKNNDYIDEMKSIGMDFTSPSSIINNTNKNPPFVENRELIYEFALDSNIEIDLEEKNIYSSKTTSKTLKHNDRRNSRANTLNLNIYNPNSLIEEIKGTVIDIFGNVLDINRNKIVLDKTLGYQGNKSDNFISIKQDERKSLSYHFEINSRKDFTNIPNYIDNTNFGRHRSNFLLDIDKEGLFKLNVPATSEKGSIPLLTRYINASILTDEPNGLIITKDNIDILQDSFAAQNANKRNVAANSNTNEFGVIKIKNGANITTPLDRINNNNINYGTAYHDLLDTCFTIQSLDYLDYLNVSNTGIVLNKTPISVISPGISPLKNIISDTINYGINSGGRSGQINFDGSIDFNVGANTIDKHSIILDTQGGIISNIGKDSRGISASISLDGALVLKAGGGKVTGDPRFTEKAFGGIIDIQTVNSGGQVHLIRIDDNGITISTPGTMNIHSAHDMNITSDNNINIDCETLILQGRMVSKGFGGSI